MRRLMLACGIAACGSPPVAAPRPEAEPAAAVDCNQLRETGLARRAAREHDAAITVFRAGLPSCARERFHHELGLALAAKGELDGAAAELVIELREGRPVAATFEQLSAIFDRLGPERRGEIGRLGRMKESAIRVPDVGLAYSWIDRFACLSSRGDTSRATRRGQAVVEHRGRRLDALLIACADGIEQMVYFEVSGR